jgi:CelD/BcsL family acetyltransferase involved in cellulose biosynthesis
MIKLKVIDNITDFEQLIPAWDQLYNALPLQSPFSASDWNLTWWKYYGKDNSLCILTIYQDDNLCGIAPLYIQQKNGIKIIKFLGSVESDYLDFLLLPEQEKECLNFIFDYLFKQKNWDILDLIDIPEKSILVQNYTDLLYPLSTAMTLLADIICPYLQWEQSYDKFLKSKSSNFRYDLKRKLKRAKQLGEVSFRFIENMDDCISFAKIAEIYQKRWKKKATDSIIRSDIGQQFLEAMCKIWETKKYLKIPVMTINDKPVAFCLGFIEHNKFYYYIPSFDPEFVNISPGNLLMEFIVENFQTLGITELDFMKGEESYKLKWSSTFRTNYRLLVANNTIKSKFIYLSLLNYIKFKNIAKTSKTLRWIRFDLLGKIKYSLKTVLK